MTKTSPLLILIILSFNLSCTRSLSSEATFTIQFPSQSQFAAGVPFTKSVSGEELWGARAIASLNEITCYAVVVGGPEADLNKNTCTYSNLSDFSYGPAAGFVKPSESISLSVPPGAGRIIRILATAVEVGKSCPTLATMDPRQVAQLRVVGEKTVDLAPGASTVEVQLNLSGEIVKTCQNLFPKAQKNSLSTCNLKRAQVAANPSLYEPNQAVVMLDRGMDIDDFLMEVDVDLDPILIGGWDQIDSYLIDFMDLGTLPEDLDRFCATPGISFVEPILLTETPSLFFETLTPPVAATSPPVVALLDTGIEDSHDVFMDSGALWVNPNEIAFDGIDNDDNGFIDDDLGWDFVNDSNYPYDDEGNGTHSAGIILTGAGLDILTPPVPASDFMIMPVKVLDMNGVGTVWNTATGILYAVQNGASVIVQNAALNEQNMLLKRALFYASANGVVVVSPAGNSAQNLDTDPLYASAYHFPLGLNVASTTAANALSAFSNYGPKSVQIAALGSSVFSTALGNSYATASGTSKAACYVAGSLIQAKALNPDLSGQQLYDTLLSTADTIAVLNGKVLNSKLVNYTTLFSQVLGLAPDAGLPLVFYPQ